MGGQRVIEHLVDYLKTQGFTAHDTDVPDGTRFPYVLVEAPPNPRRRQLALGVPGYRLPINVTIAGETPESVRRLAPRVRLALETWAPGAIGDWTIAGVTRDEYALPVARDRDQGRRTFFAVEFYQIHYH